MKVDLKNIDKPKKVKILSKVRVKEHGENEAKPCLPGDVVTVSGTTEYELITRDLATYDVNTKAADEKKPAVK